MGNILIPNYCFLRVTANRTEVTRAYLYVKEREHSEIIPFISDNSTSAKFTGINKHIKMFKRSVLKLNHRQFKKIFTLENSCNKRLPPAAYYGRFFSNSIEKSEGSDSSVTKSEGHDIERLKETSDKPLKNVPFIKELFLGRFDKVIFKIRMQTCIYKVQYHQKVIRDQVFNFLPTD